MQKRRIYLALITAAVLFSSSVPVYATEETPDQLDAINAISESEDLDETSETEEAVPEEETEDSQDSESVEIIDEETEETGTTEETEESLNESETIDEEIVEDVADEEILEEETTEVVNKKARSLSTSYDNEFNLMGDGKISIDGDFSDWEGLPYSYEYNWDNSQNCWQWGVWVDGVCYKTEEGTYSTDVRHKMQLYCDGSYVYLHIIISRDYGSKFNGEDYQFWVDGNMAAFQVEWPGGGTITGNLGNTSPGVYPVEVRHRDSSMSYDVATGSSGYLKVNENNLNDELEIKIPLSELQRQNGNINSETISTIEFFTPNLMYRRISSAGTSTAPYIIGLICFALVCVTTIAVLKKKTDEGEKHDKEQVQL